MQQQKWSFFQKIGFLFMFCYLVLYINPVQFIVPTLFESLWKFLIPQFAKILGYTKEIAIPLPGGSGDGIYNYFNMLFFVIVSLITAICIGLLDCKRSNYWGLIKWLTLLLRYFLAFAMLGYGLVKIFPQQFGNGLNTLILEQTLGDMSPMRLLWTFMGFSRPYTMFTGVLEVLGGLLLLSRYTTTLGALLTFGVMSNVMMLNYCYDVPVKLFSTHLVFMALFLIALDGKRLLRFFITNQTVTPYVLEGIVPKKYEKAGCVTKWILIVACVGFSMYQLNDMIQKYSEKTIFDGKYTVESFTQCDENLQMVEVADSVRWKAFYQPSKGFAIIKTETDKTLYKSLEIDTLKQLFKIKSRRDSVTYDLKYEPMEDNKFHIYGNYEGSSLDLILKKEEKEYLLLNRGFHWISEYPYNR